MYIKNWSGIENTQWHVGLVCANAPYVTASITKPTTTVNITVGQSLDFAGTASSSDGTIVSYNWTFLNSTIPAASLPSLTGANLSAVTFPYEGAYIVTLTATDNSGTTRTATVFVVVEP